MDDEPEVIRQQMKTTRSDLTQKIEALENQVVGTVQSTTQAVTDTVASVKEAVQKTVSSVKDTVSGTVSAVKDTVGETVESVKEALDLRGYVRKYPWASFGTAVAAGYVGGLLLGGGRRAEGDRITEMRSRGEPAVSYGRGGYDRFARASRRDLEEEARSSSFTASPAHATPTWMSQLASKFEPELNKLKGLALGTVFGLVRNWVAESSPPEVGSRISQVIDDFTRKLGGEPVHGPLLNFGRADCPPGGKSSREREAASEAHAARASAGL